MSDDASAYGTEDEQTGSDQYDLDDATEQDEYPVGVPEEQDSQELDEEHTDDPEYE